MIAQVQNIFIEIKNFYSNQEKELSDLFKISEMFYSGQKDIFTDPEKFMEQISNGKLHLQNEIINKMVDKLKRTVQGMSLAGFLQLEQLLSDLFNDPNGVLQCTNKYLSDSVDWYKFLKKFLDFLCKYDQQTHIGFEGAEVIMNDVTSLISQCEKRQSCPLRRSIILYYIELLLPCSVSKFQNMAVNSFKLKNFNILLKLVMQKPTGKKLNDESYLVTGYNVKLSDFSHTMNEFKFVKVFALDKIFIDTNINQTGMENEILLIAPVMEVVNKHTIILSGSDAETHNRPKAKSGQDGRLVDNFDGECGNEGMMGNPGGSSGHFFCVADIFVDSHNLKIEARGGDGSKGQDGGDGK